MNMPRSHRAEDGNRSGTAGPPPILVGYTYAPAEAYRARDDGRLLAIRLETNRTCNLRCRYCYAESGVDPDAVGPYEVLLDRVEQAYRLGASSIVVIGGGEPTIHPRFRDLIGRIHKLGMVPMVFSNCLAVDGDLAAFLFDRGASVMTKLDSLRADRQDFLAGMDGASDRMRRGIEQLLEAGFGRPDDPGRLRLGASFVSCRMNRDEIADIWRFCRERNIFPNMEVLTPTGRAKETLPDQGLETADIQQYKFDLLHLDQEDFGYDWLPYTPLAGSGCLQHLYSLYVTLEGNVRPCAPTKFDEHPDLRVDGTYPYNTGLMTLGEIYTSPLFRYVRHIDAHLEGKCGGCEHLDECIGCRGYAYAVGVNAGKPPHVALRGECLQCAKPAAGATVP
ncbi:MAG: radical SAM protein [Phycisphaerae bacterium]